MIDDDVDISFATFHPSEDTFVEENPQGVLNGECVNNITTPSSLMTNDVLIMVQLVRFHRAPMRFLCHLQWQRL